MTYENRILELRKAADEWRANHPSVSTFETRYDLALLDAADAIEELLRPRRGEWIRCGDGENVPYQCSHCGKTVPAILVENWAGVKYCPMCGKPVDKYGDGE